MKADRKQFRRNRPSLPKSPLSAPRRSSDGGIASPPESEAIRAENKPSCTKAQPCSDPACTKVCHYENGNLRWPEQLKKTRQRRLLMELLMNSLHPLSAADIYRDLVEEDRRVSLSTVYRNLESLREAHLLRSVSIPDDETLYYELDRGGHSHYAVCTKCHKIFRLNHCPLPAHFPELESMGFQVNSHRVELYGICKDCLGA